MLIIIDPKDNAIYHIQFNMFLNSYWLSGKVYNKCSIYINHYRFWIYCLSN